MGYDTRFSGRVSVNPPMGLALYQSLKQLNENDQRNSGPWQREGAPGYHCPWVPTEQGDALVWDGNEKSYDAEEWMRLIVNELWAAQHVCDGTIEANGEEAGDVWRIVVEKSAVSVKRAEIRW